MGDCWYKDCCVFDQSVIKCGLKDMSGQEKIQVLLHDTETSRLVQSF